MAAVPISDRFPPGTGRLLPVFFHANYASIAQTNMNIFLRVLIGLVVAGVGAFMVIRTEAFLGFFGTVDWAERKLGSSRLFYKLLGILICFIGFMVATNLWNAFLEATLGGLFPKPA